MLRIQSQMHHSFCYHQQNHEHKNGLYSSKHKFFLCESSYSDNNEYESYCLLGCDAM
jgi:hypothetical protein